MTKTNCYNCKYRGTVPGDAHSCCNHPAIDNNPPGQTMIMSLLGVASTAQQELNIKANAHGVQSCWFFWPVNFDPVWLENCDGYTPKE